MHRRLGAIERRWTWPARSLAAALLGASFSLAGLTGAAAQPAEPTTAAEDTGARLKRASDAVVGIETRAVPGARSVDTLGPLRRGSGIVVGTDGLVLTIGYLILEADSVDVVLDDHRRVPARAVAYDLATGFGLVQALLPLPLQPAPLGDASSLQDDEVLLFASGGDEGALSMARLQARRSFAGYWEYHIDGALFTAPARGDHSGAGLFNRQGELVGVGSLFVPDVAEDGSRLPGNMFVPIDLLKPIFAELRTHGTTRASQRPWLGVSCAEADGSVQVLRVARDSPAESAGLRPGDRIAGVDGVAVAGLEAFYKAVWSHRDAEAEVRLEIHRGQQRQTLTVRGIDRTKVLMRPAGI